MLIEDRVLVLHIGNKTKIDISNDFIKMCQHFKNLVYLIIKEKGYSVLNISAFKKSLVEKNRKQLSVKEIEIIDKIQSSSYFPSLKEVSKNLSSVTAQKLIEQVMNEYKSYFNALKDYKENSRKYKNKPNPPKPKKLSRINNFSVSFVKNNFKIKNNGLILTLNNYLKLKFKLPKFMLRKEISSIRLVKRLDEYELHIVYKEKILKENLLLNKNIYVGIDLGLDNLASIFTNNPSIESLIINGKQIKSFNQWFNKKKAELQSLKDKSDNIEEKIKYDYLIRKLYRYRNKKIKIWFHLISTRMVEYALLSKAKHIIISRDILESKNGINLGKTNNQNFVSIPFGLLIDMIKYKAKKYGIEVSDKEKEYFTSQANCLTNDIRKVMKNKNIELSGKRLIRGLYQDFVYNLKFNADINGAVNIIKRVKSKFINFYFKSKELFKVLKRKLCRPIKFNIYQLQNANLFLHRLLSMPTGISNYCSGLNAEIYKFLYIF